MNPFRVANVNPMSARLEWMRRMGAGDDRRNIEHECGYPTDMTAWDYWALYERHEIASRVVDLYPDYCWLAQATVYDDERSDKNTPFEDAWDAVGSGLAVDGESWYGEEVSSPVWDYLLRLDRVSGVGSYGVLLLGFDDGRPLNEPLDQGSAKALKYLRVFDESTAPIVRFVRDPSSPRYGHPEAYNLSFHPLDSSQPQTTPPQQTVEVHWSRVIHVADGRTTSDTFGTSRLQKPLNCLLDHRKIRGGSAEMFWKGAFPGYTFTPFPGESAQLDVRGLRSQLENYMNSLDRFLGAEGGSWGSMAQQVADPTGHLQSQVQSICICLQVPMRVFMGTERGQLASSQDERDWRTKYRARSKGHCTSRILVPFVNRLIYAGALPEPKEGKFLVHWEDPEEASQAEVVSIGAQRADALSKYVGGNLEAVIAPMDFATRFLGFEDVEAEAMLKSAEQNADDRMTPDPEEARQQQQQADAEKAKLDAKLKEKAVERGVPAPPVPPAQAGQPPAQPAKPIRNRGWRTLTGPVLNEATEPNCGTGSGGFKPGNKCAKGGGSDRSPGPVGGWAHPPANRNGLDTQSAYQRSDGSWTKERTALHDSIVAGAMVGKSPVANPVAYIMGGGPAAGKSSILKAAGGPKIPDNTVHIDPDQMKAKLPEYARMSAAGDVKAAAFAHEESSHLAKRLQAEASGGRYNTLLDGTGDSGIDSLAKKVAVMRNAGQRVVAHYVTVDTETAVARSNARGEKTGRYVPESVIRHTHAQVSRTVPEAIRRGLYDDFTLWDTNGGGAKAVATAKGKVLTVHDQAAWDRFLRKGDE